MSGLRGVGGWVGGWFGRIGSLHAAPGIEWIAESLNVFQGLLGRSGTIALLTIFGILRYRRL